MSAKPEMDEATRERLRNHWITRAMRATREAYLATDHADPMYLIIDAACMAVPLFGDEPYFQRPTPTKNVGGVIRYVPGTKDKCLMTNVFIPGRQEVRMLRVCYVAELVDNLGRLIEAIDCTSVEADELLDKVRRWITHDDCEGDDTPDKVSWATQVVARQG